MVYDQILLNFSVYKDNIYLTEDLEKNTEMNQKRLQGCVGERRGGGSFAGLAIRGQLSRPPGRPGEGLPARGGQGRPHLVLRSLFPSPGAWGKLWADTGCGCACPALRGEGAPHS